jgi:N-acetylneuraminic acid mutarotase
MRNDCGHWRERAVSRVTGRTLFAFLIGLVLAGCGGGGGGTQTPPPETANAPTITTQPASQNFAANSPASFTIAASGNGTLTYQWLVNGAPINGATSATLTLTSSVTDSYDGSYTCIVTNSLNGTMASTTSAAATLLVVHAPGGAIINGESAVLPNSANHTVSTLLQGESNYLWSVSNGTIVGGQGTSNLTYSAGNLGHIQITVTVSNVAGTAVAVKNVVVAASLPIVSLFTQPAVLVGTQNSVASTPVDTGQTYGWVLAPGATVAIPVGSQNPGQYAFSAGNTAGSFQLSVDVSDSAGRSTTVTRTVGVLSNTFFRDPRDVTPRSLHTATLLNDGRVLVVGGDAGVPDYDVSHIPKAGSQSNLVATAELFDPVTSTWAFVGSLPSARFEHSATLLNDGRVLVAGGSDASGSFLASVEIYDPVARTWNAGASMANPRALHSATLLADGRVLVTGGVDASGVLNAPEVYDPTADSWTSAGTMSSPRVFHSAALLPNGQVLIAGGQAGVQAQAGALGSAERYDPSTNSWSAAATMQQAASSTGAVLLASGKVLLAGTLGQIYDPVADSWQAATSPPGPGNQLPGPGGSAALLLADGRVLAGGGFGYLAGMATLYDPVVQSWSPTHFAFAPYASMTELPDGRVLFIGGIGHGGVTADSSQYQPLAGATVLDPQTGAATVLGSQAYAGAFAAASVLADGRVLVSGGSNYYRVPQTATAVASAGIFDPTTNTWTTAASMSTVRLQHVQTTLANGSVLVTGGSDGNLRLFASAEVYSPGADAWSTAGAMSSARYQHSATRLNDGRVLVAGGSNLPDQPSGCSCTTYLASADIYNPTSNTWAATGTLVTARYHHTATLLNNGKVLVTGGFGGATSTLMSGGGALASAELYDPSSGTWSGAASMSTARMNHTATLLASGKVLVAGGSNGSATIASAEVYDPASDTWTPVAAMSTPRQFQGAQILASGSVLVVGGLNDSTSAVFGVSSAELYDPSANAWSAAGSMVTPRQYFVLAALGDGRVLLDGGGPNAVALPEFYH